MLYKLVGELLEHICQVRHRTLHTVEIHGVVCAFHAAVPLGALRLRHVLVGYLCKPLSVGNVFRGPICNK